MPNQMREFTLPAKRARSGVDPLTNFLLQSEGQGVRLSMADVDRIDSLRLRTLLSAQSHWLGNGLPFVLTHVSPTFQTGLEHLGLTSAHFAEESS